MSKEIKDMNSTIADRETSGAVKNAHRKLKYGSMSLVVLALVIVAVVLINIMAGYMAKRTPMKIDLTQDKRYELSDETIDYLKNKLDKEVNILVTCPKENFAAIGYQMEQYYYQQSYGQYKLDCPFDMIPVILDKYTMYANQGEGKINVSYVDLNKNPDATKKYAKNYSGDFEAESIIVSSGDRVRVISQADVYSMITFDQSNKSTPSMVFAGESKITSEIMNVTDAHPVKVAFASTLNGQPIYNEVFESTYGCVSGLRDQLLTKNGYICTEIDLASDDLSPDDYDMIVLPMPNVDFDKAIIEKLSDFLYNSEDYGKNLLYIPDFTTTGLSNIDEFLADWSIEVTNDLVADQEKYMQDNSGYPLYNVLSKPVSSDEYTGFKDGAQFVSPYTCQLKALTKNSEAVTQSVIQSYDSAVSTDTDGNQADAGVMDLGIVSKKETAVGTSIYTSHVFVLGSAISTSSSILAQTRLYDNTSILLKILNTMTGKDDGVIISDKALQTATIAPSASQAKVLKNVVIWIIPAIVVLIGGYVLLRRKNK